MSLNKSLGNKKQHNESRAYDKQAKSKLETIFWSDFLILVYINSIRNVGRLREIKYCTTFSCYTKVTFYGKIRKPILTDLCWKICRQVL